MHGPLAQLGERQVRNLEVRGSIPLWSIKISTPAVLETAGVFLSFSLVYHVFRTLRSFAFTRIAILPMTLLNTNKRHFYERIYERFILPAEFGALLLKLCQI